jgi:hypothetical protein
LAKANPTPENKDSTKWHKYFWKSIALRPFRLLVMWYNIKTISISIQEVPNSTGLESRSSAKDVSENFSMWCRCGRF